MGQDLATQGPVAAIPYREAEFHVIEVDENGSITKLEMVNGDGGVGYIPWWANSIFPILEFPHFHFPSVYSVDENGTLCVTGRSGIKGLGESNKRPVLGYISVTGGGGIGAEIWITGLTDPGFGVDGNATHPDIVIVDGGRGYFNIDPDNFPEANITLATAGTGEVNASVVTRLGGYLNKIPTAGGKHIAPWIEIWDRGRPEKRIDQLNARARATPKVVNGKIEKVVVVDPGSGYVDPIAIVRDYAPRVSEYLDSDSSTTVVSVYRRIWKCTFPRITLDGEEVICGHVHAGMYPPDECPGETDDEYPYQDENGTVLPTTGNLVEEWQARHENPEIDFPIEDPEINTVMHRYCVSAAALGAETAHDHNNSVHLNVGFLSRKCWGTKENYMLLNPQYRKKPEAWAWLDANLSVEVHNGKIKKIVVDYPGDNYFAPSLVVEGSGSGVVGIPVYNDGGTMTDVLFDDPDLTNTHFDTHIVRPSGAGQGFRERPWSWDTAYDSVSSPQEKLFIYRKAADGG